jgi:Na+/glutamate symporter
MAIKIIAAILFFLISIATGIWLTNNGKPLNPWIFNTHKLIALAAAVFTGLVIRNLLKSFETDAIFITMVILLVLFYLSLFVTGGLLSVEKEFPGIVLMLHKIAPALVLILSIVLGFLIKQKI